MKLVGLKIGAFASNFKAEFSRSKDNCIFGGGIAFFLSSAFAGFSALIGENSIFGAVDGTNELAATFRLGLNYIIFNGFFSGILTSTLSSELIFVFF
jgi:hypothetical protein